MQPGCDPHRFRCGTESGVLTGWKKDNFSFWAYANPTAGTAVFYVMERGGGDPTQGDPARCEITQHPVPTPGWHIRFKFYAYPSHEIY